MKKGKTTVSPHLKRERVFINKDGMRITGIRGQVIPDSQETPDVDELVSQDPEIIALEKEIAKKKRLKELQEELKKLES